MFLFSLKNLTGQLCQFSGAKLLQRGYSMFAGPASLRTALSPTGVSLTNNTALLTATREMNRNARRPKAANHGKRPVSNARRREKLGKLKSRAYREKIFGFW